MKERVCPLVIKLFSPSIKHRQGIVAPSPPTSPEKPSFPISMRLLRVVSVLINKYYTLLVSTIIRHPAYKYYTLLVSTVISSV